MSELGNITCSTGATISNWQPTHLTIMGNGQDFLVKISLNDGSIEYGASYTPDEAARVFWESIGRAHAL
jgi:hypothetical protein